ncbi:MAG: hypothetical protein GYA17_08655 [Chloroflexi bacterium]|jgi:hypothetical protein|nr:hypothetical protein [Anaerolineaceae bacterium]NMB88420.1 hypothetical protein [Chloroflexota bacterium]
MAATNVSRGIQSHPYTLDSLNELPRPLLGLATRHLPPGQQVEEVLVVPPETYPRSYRRRPSPLQALVFTGQGMLHVAAGDEQDGPGSGQWIPVDQVFKVRLSLILLYGKLEVWGEHNGKVNKFEVEYNTVAHLLLARGLRAFLRKTWEPNPPAGVGVAEPDSFQHFGSVAFGFYNGLREEALHDGQKLLGYVYQPEIRRPWLKFFHKKVAPRLVAALSDQQAILLSEDLAYKAHHEWIFTFCPLHRLLRLEEEPMQEWRQVSICLQPDLPEERVRMVMEAEQAAAFRRTWVQAYPWLAGR